jgi:DNA-binding XRE family transcriptional regulator
MRNLEGWQVAAARCAAKWGYRELAAAADVATSTIIKIEQMPSIAVAASGRKVKGKVAPDVMERLLAAFEQAGFRLMPATATRPARVERIE